MTRAMVERALSPERPDSQAMTDAPPPPSILDLGPELLDAILGMLADADVACARLACAALNTRAPQAPVRKLALLERAASAAVVSWAVAQPGFDDGPRLCAQAKSARVLDRLCAARGCCEQPLCFICCADPRCAAHTTPFGDAAELPKLLGMRDYFATTIAVLDQFLRSGQPTLTLPRTLGKRQRAEMHRVCAMIGLGHESIEVVGSKRNPINKQMVLTRPPAWQQRVRRPKPRPLSEEEKRAARCKCESCGRNGLEAWRDLCHTYDGIMCSRCIDALDKDDDVRCHKIESVDFSYPLGRRAAASRGRW